MTGHIMHADIPYAEPVGTAHLLDVYVPASGDGPFPVVMLWSTPPDTPARILWREGTVRCCGHPEV